MCHRAHGARAQRSDRNRNDNVTPVGEQRGSDRIGRFHHGSGISLAHDSIMSGCNTADHAVRRELTRPVDRMDNVEVPLKTRAIEVDRQVAHEDIIVVPTTWHCTLLTRSKWDRLVAVVHQRRPADDRHTAFRQRWSAEKRSRIEVRARQVCHCRSSRSRNILEACHSA